MNIDTVSFIHWGSSTLKLFVSTLKTPRHSLTYFLLLPTAAHLVFCHKFLRSGETPSSLRPKPGVRFEDGPKASYDRRISRACFLCQMVRNYCPCMIARTEAAWLSSHPACPGLLRFEVQDSLQPAPRISSRFAIDDRSGKIISHRMHALRTALSMTLSCKRTGFGSLKVPFSIYTLGLKWFFFFCKLGNPSCRL